MASVTPDGAFAADLLPQSDRSATGVAELQTLVQAISAFESRVPVNLAQATAQDDALHATLVAPLG